MNLRKWKLQKKLYLCIASVLVLVSCQSQPYSKAYLPPLPIQKDLPSLEKEPKEYLETLINNYKNALEWITIVWLANRESL